MFKKKFKHHTQKHTVILADNGYYSEYALDYMENHNLTAIIPNRTQSMKVKPKTKKINHLEK